MKKNIVRIVAALLVAMLALTLIPMGAFAAENDISFTDSIWYTDDSEFEIENDWFTNANWHDYMDSIYIGPNSVTIKTSSYDDNIIIDGKLYDIDQLYLTSQNSDGTYTFKGIGNSITVPGAPSDISSEEYQDWFNKYYWLDLGYTAHQHKLSRWYSDGTTHWRECLVCKKFCAQGFHKKFMYQNWCQDGDEDGICNICGGDVPYHDVTVVESEGGKITVNRDNASHRMKITADVEPAEGYKLKQLHFTKIRDNGTRQEITRYKKDGQFWTRMPTYELEVSAEFVKTK